MTASRLIAPYADCTALIALEQRQTTYLPTAYHTAYLALPLHQRLPPSPTPKSDASAFAQLPNTLLRVGLIDIDC